MAQTINLISTIDLKSVNKSWTTYNSQYMAIGFGHGASTTVNTSVFARASYSLRYNENSDKFEIKNIELQLQKSNSSNTTQVVTISAGTISFTGFNTTNSSANPTNVASYMLNNISTSPSTSWTTSKTFISSGYADINPNKTAQCIVRNIKTIINGFTSSADENTRDVTITISINTPKSKVTYTFNGNGGKINGQNTVTTTALSGGTMRIPAAAQRSSEDGTGNFTVTFNPDNGSSTFTAKCQYPTKIDWSSNGYARVDNKSITVAAGTQDYRLDSDDKNKDRSWNAIWDDNEKRTGSGSSNYWPSEPSKFGHSFIGWFKSNGDQITSLRGNVEGDFTLTARWDPKKYVVSYKADTVKNCVYLIGNNENFITCNGAEKKNQKIFGKPATINSKIPVAFGYKFKGWGTQTECLYPVGTTTFDDKIVTANKLISDITLYAHWEPLNDLVITNFYRSSSHKLVTNTITYNINNDACVVNEPSEREENASDWVFLGWYQHKNPGKPPYQHVPSKNGVEFWGNESAAISLFGQEFKDYAWGTFRNPDIVDASTDGKLISPYIINVSGIKQEYKKQWDGLKNQSDNTWYDNINKAAWGREWKLYGFWTISGKWVKLDTNDWRKVKSMYVKVPVVIDQETGEKELVWKYVSDLSMMIQKPGQSGPDWAREIWK